MRFEEALSVAKEGIAAADPERAVMENLSLNEGVLSVCGQSFDLDNYEKIIVIGAGKASERMASGIEKILGDRISEGLVITKKRLGLTERIEVIEGSHPLPDEKSLKATRRVMELLAHCGVKDLVVVLISGGGSSLLCYPKVSLGAFREVTERLMKAGADIKELNTVRKKLSLVKGGKLAALAKGEVISLIISDVVGDPLEFIASGPTVSDTSTNRGALEILRKYGIDVNDEVIECLSSEEGVVESRAKNYLIATNRRSLEVMKEEAEKRGYRAFILSPFFEGEAVQLGLFLSAIAKGMELRKVCILCGGEAVVNVKGSGRGGPNMEIAASFALGIDGAKASIACIASDGEDGSTYAAGAFADNTTKIRAEELGLNIKEHLKNNDTLSLFERLGGLIVTGSTGTNVNSFWLLSIEE